MAEKKSTVILPVNPAEILAETDQVARVLRSLPVRGAIMASAAETTRYVPMRKPDGTWVRLLVNPSKGPRRKPSFRIRAGVR
jgi:hypothetical protein